MSNKKLTGEEQITPTLTYDETSGKPNGHLLGLTIRQHFAAVAMQGLLTQGYSQFMQNVNDAAGDAVAAADALITELNR